MAIDIATGNENIIQQIIYMKMRKSNSSSEHKTKIGAILVLVFACHLSAQAQSDTLSTSEQFPQIWTLNECIHYALEHNISIQQAGMQAEMQEIQHQTARAQRLPYLSASASQSAGFGQTQDRTGVYQNNNSLSTSAGLNAGVTIFNGFQINNNIEAQKFSSLAAMENLNKAKEDLSLNIASAYMQILYNKELYQIAQEQVNLSREQLEQYQTRATLGNIPEGQLYEIKAQLSQDQLTATQNKQTLQLSILDLAQLLELDEWQNFDIIEPDSDQLQGNILLLSPADSIYQYAKNNKSEIKAAEYQVKSSEKSLSVSKGARYPSLSLGASYSNSYYNYNNTENMSLQDQINSNGRTYIGLSLSVPIFNQFSTSNKIKQSAMNVESARLDLENAQKTLFKEIQQAWFNANAAEEKYQASFETIAATEEAFRFAKEKFENGRSTVYEYNEAKMKLAQTRSNQVQAKYNYLLCMKILAFYQGGEIY